MLQTADYYTVPSKYVLKAMMAYPEFNPKKHSYYPILPVSKKQIIIIVL